MLATPVQLLTIPGLVSDSPSCPSRAAAFTRAMETSLSAVTVGRAGSTSLKSRGMTSRHPFVLYECPHPCGERAEAE